MATLKNLSQIANEIANELGNIEHEVLIEIHSKLFPLPAQKIESVNGETFEVLPETPAA